MTLTAVLAELIPVWVLVTVDTAAELSEPEFLEFLSICDHCLVTAGTLHFHMLAQQWKSGLCMIESGSRLERVRIMAIKTS